MSNIKLTLLITAVSLNFVSCASIQEQNHRYTKQCAESNLEDDVLLCHRQAIFNRIRSRVRTISTDLSESDLPDLFEIQTVIRVDNNGNIIHIDVLNGTDSRRLDRRILKGIGYSSPLPVPAEPLFTKGDFSTMRYQFVHSTGDVPPVFNNFMDIFRSNIVEVRHTKENAITLESRTLRR